MLNKNKTNLKPNRISYTKTLHRLKGQAVVLAKLKQAVKSIEIETNTEKLQKFLTELVKYTNDLIHTMNKAREYNNSKSWNLIIKQIGTQHRSIQIPYLIKNIFEYSENMIKVLKEQKAFYIEYVE